MYILMLIISISPDDSITTWATQHGREKVRKITWDPPPYFLCVSKTTFHLYEHGRQKENCPIHPETSSPSPSLLNILLP